MREGEVEAGGGEMRDYDSEGGRGRGWWWRSEGLR